MSNNEKMPQKKPEIGMRTKLHNGLTIALLGLTAYLAYDNFSLRNQEVVLEFDKRGSFQYGSHLKDELDGSSTHKQETVRLKRGQCQDLTPTIFAGGTTFLGPGFVEKGRVRANAQFGTTVCLGE
jgi:hypothetical protein